MTHPKVCISILNWNNAEETLRCVESLSGVFSPHIKIVILDNGSTDSSVEILSNVNHVEFISNPINLGFAGGHNLVIQHALQQGFDYVWLLNNDALVEQDCLAKLLTCAESNPRVGMVSPVIKDLDPPHAYQHVLTLLNDTGTGVDECADPIQAANLQTQSPSRVILWGTGLLIKRTTFEKVGLLDEKLFAYSEDTDYSLRCMRHGLHNQVVFDAVMLHYQPTGSRKAHYYYYTQRNAFLTWKKYVSLFNLLRLTRWNLQLAKRQIASLGHQTELVDSLQLGIWHGWVNRGGAFEKGQKLGYVPRLVVKSLLALA